ncbi:hypothetical protein [Legionella saoudiensis]|uniref:hypothetical protein n=1 Tax=Legionella saoudiensis TaxID=1750561 RepID=UPI0007309460|nr:hypothetical protein [Legionella saoudiensis]
MGFWPTKENEGEFFTSSPNFDLLINNNELSYRSLASLIQDLNNASIKFSAQELEKSNFFPWLTFALGCAVKLAGMDHKTKLDTNPIMLITSLVQSILNNDPDIMHAMFNQQINEGHFKGQNFAYFWMDNFCSLVYSSNDDLSSLEALNLMFQKLVNVLGSRFCSLLIQNNEEGNQKGKNALLALLRSYQKSASEMSNKLETQLIAELFHCCMQKDWSLMGAALTQEITESLFRGKSCLYLLSCILLQATKFENKASITIIQDVMLHALKEHPKQFADSFYKRHAQGLYPGLSSFHLILLSLVEAAYKNNDSEVIAQLMAIFNELLKHDNKVDVVISELLQTIKAGEYQELNGLVFLCRALVAAMAHHIDVTPMMNFILDVIKVAPADLLATAVFQSAPAHAVPEYTHSPINQMINLVQDKNKPVQQQNAQAIIDALVYSQAGSQIRTLLSPDARFFFVSGVDPKSQNDLFEEPSVSTVAKMAGSSSSTGSSVSSKIRLFASRKEDKEVIFKDFPKPM